MKEEKKGLDDVGRDLPGSGGSHFDDPGKEKRRIPKRGMKGG